MQPNETPDEIPAPTRPPYGLLFSLQVSATEILDVKSEVPRVLQVQFDILLPQSLYTLRAYNVFEKWRRGKVMSFRPYKASSSCTDTQLLLKEANGKV